jgi:hypothetical protein
MECDPLGLIFEYTTDSVAVQWARKNIRRSFDRFGMGIFGGFTPNSVNLYQILLDKQPRLDTIWRKGL